MNQHRTGYVITRPSRGGPMAGAKAHRADCKRLHGRIWPAITEECAEQMRRLFASCHYCLPHQVKKG